MAGSSLINVSDIRIPVKLGNRVTYDLFALESMYIFLMGNQYRIGVSPHLSSFLCFPQKVNRFNQLPVGLLNVCVIEYL